jgi:Flp pilus assembly protein TadD
MSDPGIRHLWAAANAALAQGSPLRAIEALRRVLSVDPDDAQAHALLALCLVDARRLAAAEIEAKLALAGDPLSPLSHVAMGQVSFARRDFVKAEERFRAVLEMEPDRSENHRRLGILHRVTGRREEAERELVRAVELAPDDPENLVALGQLCLSAGDVAEAERLAREALTLAPANRDGLVLMGLVLLRRGDVESAREHALWAIRIDPTDRGALSLMASIQAKTSWYLGLWWRFNTWCSEVGSKNVAILLLSAFILYRFLRQILVDMDHAQGAQLVSYAWLAVCVYSWVGPGLFRRELNKELETVRLRRDF